MISRLTATLALILSEHVHGGYKEKERDFLYRERFSQFNCHKLIGCVPNGPKVCGFDERASFLAYFADICTMYKANCKKAGFYSQVKIEACDVKQNYTMTFADEFKFEPIVRPTKPPSKPSFLDETVLRIVEKNKTNMPGVGREETKQDNGFGVFRLV